MLFLKTITKKCNPKGSNNKSGQFIDWSGKQRNNVMFCSCGEVTTSVV